MVSGGDPIFFVCSGVSTDNLAAVHRYLAFVACFPGVWRKLFFVQLSHAAFFVLHLQARTFILLELSLNVVFCPQSLH